MLFFSDYAILVLCIVLGCIFVLLGESRLYKFYLGAIIGFLLFLVVNSQIQILEGDTPVDITFFQDFILKNKDFILTLTVYGIPGIGAIFMLSNHIEIKGKNNLWMTLLFGGIVPIFLLGIFGYVTEYAHVPLTFLDDILDILGQSFFLDYFQENTHILFLGILFLLFYKTIFTLLLAFIVYIIQRIWIEIFGEKTEEDEDEGE